MFFFSHSPDFHGIANETDVKHLQELFVTFDVDGSGEIDVEEFVSHAAWSATPDEAMPEHLRSMFASMDVDDSGCVTLREFIEAAYPTATREQIDGMMGSLSKGQRSRVKRNVLDRLDASQTLELRKLFDTFDEDHGGTLTIEELCEVLARNAGGGQGLTKEDVRDVVVAVDLDGSGELDFEEFAELMVEGLGMI